MSEGRHLSWRCDPWWSRTPAADDFGCGRVMQGQPVPAVDRRGRLENLIAIDVDGIAHRRDDPVVPLRRRDEHPSKKQADILDRTIIGSGAWRCKCFCFARRSEVAPLRICRARKSSGWASCQLLGRACVPRRTGPPASGLPGASGRQSGSGRGRSLVWRSARPALCTGKRRVLKGPLAHDALAYAAAV
jgi:hypothetical protein